MTNERLIIEMTCIDEGNEWGLNYGQKVYYAENFPFVKSLPAITSRVQKERT